ncbi:cobyrinic acid a,c-diamide synthase [Balneicella halophila]|uniref:Cobyrinate a,c-diamide synthase n=1 Tax=Balneicella halophila TaxID=1537566 RepID=A0A7L4UQW1_BALHA|nr:cobyrinate a,c-diamide synthase [Balneicella halophila]PVX52156.1 cobyrinic acid a,c-diamide synthase [Balneicella halophila]
MTTSAFLIAAPSSGAGKTTLTLGLLRALHNREMKVQAFKSGPDYIDTKFHELATQKPSINLDMFFCEDDEIQQLFNYYAKDKDVAIIEGVMGLFDGYDRQKGSSSAIAKLLDIPVVLVVNGKSVAYSMAALLYGYKNFDKDIRIAGVIFNNVSTESHYKILKDAAESVGLKSFGYVPVNKNISVPSRHLGLNIDEKYRLTSYADELANHVQNHVDIDLLLKSTKKEILSTNKFRIPKSQNLKIGIAKDEAFNFMYPENVRKLASLGEVSFFSPIRDQALPEKLTHIYLPGGYPEFFLEELSQNTSMKTAIKEFAERGGYIWAECGGMLYLCQQMSDESGNTYPLANILNLQGTLEEMKLKLGYRQFEHNGIPLKGHEFHYSSLTENHEPSIAQLYSAKNKPVPTKLFRYKNVIAGYTHIYWKSHKDFLKIFD